MRKEQRKQQQLLDVNIASGFFELGKNMTTGKKKFDELRYGLDEVGSAGVNFLVILVQTTVKSLSGKTGLNARASSVVPD